MEDNSLKTEKVEVNLSSFYRLLHPKFAVLITSLNTLKDKQNIMTLAWAMPISRNPPLLLIGIAPQKYSLELIAGPKEFVVNIPTMGIIKETLFCGKTTGREHDKFAETGLTPLPAKMIHPPIIKECVAHLECKLHQQIAMGDHTLFVGEVLTAYVNKDAFLNSKFNLEKVKLLYHAGGNEFAALNPETVTPILEKMKE